MKKIPPRFDVLFNDKSQLIIFKARNEYVPVPDIFINGIKLKAVNCIDHLGHIIHDNIFVNDGTKCVRDFYIQFNAFMGDFRYLGSCLRNIYFLNIVHHFMAPNFYLFMIPK